MLTQDIKTFWNKHYFVTFLIISALAHVILIANSTKIKRVFSNYGITSVDSESGKDTTIEFVLNDGVQNVALQDKPAALDLIDELVDDDPELEEKKQQMFVDSSESEIDEESQEDSDKIGEKGSIARDMRPNDENMDGETFSEGETDILELKKSSNGNPDEPGGAVYAMNFEQEQTAVPEQELIEEVKQAEEEIEPEKVVEENKPEAKPAESKNEEFIKAEEEFVEDDSIVDEEEKTAKVEDIKEPEREVAENEFQPVKYREFESEFERIIPSPVEPPLTAEVEPMETPDPQPERDENEPDKSEKKLSKMTTMEKEKLLQKIYELYDEDIEKRENNPGYKPKPKVAMSVNGKRGSNARQQPTVKADLSNTALQGEASFNIKKHEYASYYKHIRDKISLFWLLKFGTDQSIDLQTMSGNPVIVEFKIVPSGRIVDVSIAEDAGNPFLASRTQISVSNTRLDEFPEFIEEEFIDVRFNFYFF